MGVGSSATRGPSAQGMQATLEGVTKSQGEYAQARHAPQDHVREPLVSLPVDVQQQRAKLFVPASKPEVALQ